MEIFRHEQLHMQSPPPEKKKSGAVVCIVALIVAAVSLVLSVTALILALKSKGEAGTEDYADIFASVKSSVVEVYCSSEAGSGVVYRLSGEQVYIVTNYHVVKSHDIDGVRTSVRFTEFGDKIDGEVLGYDEYHDIALLRVNMRDAYGATPKAAVIGDRPTTGEKVLTVGNNLGYGIAAFDGIVSKADRMLKVENNDGATKRVPVVAVTCPINAGMSGGGLFDSRGRLVGINTYQSSMTNGTTVYGMGYCVPITIADRLAKLIFTEQSGALTEIPTVKGNIYIEDQIDFESLLMSATFCGDGLKVTAVGYDTANPPAYIEGNVQVGDTITAIGGMKIDDGTDFTAVFAHCLDYTYETGNERLKVTYLRDGKQFTVTYTKLFRKNFTEVVL